MCQFLEYRALEFSDDSIYYKPARRAHILESESESECCVVSIYCTLD